LQDSYAYTRRHTPKDTRNHKRCGALGERLHQSKSHLGCRLDGQGVLDVARPIRQKTDIHGNEEPLSSRRETPDRRGDLRRRKSDLHDDQEPPWGNQGRQDPRYSVPRRTSIQEGLTGVAAAMATPKQQVGYSPGAEAARLFNGQSCKGPQMGLDQRGHEVVTQWATRLRDQPY
jgi:hypothetical protein